MKLLAGILFAVCALPSFAIDKITALAIDGASYSQIQDVHVGDGGRVVILFPGGGTTTTADKLPPGFLDSWGITADQLDQSRKAAQKQAAQSLDQAIAAGYFREVEGVVYDLRKPQAGWLRLSGKILQVLPDGALVDPAPGQQDSIPLLLRHLPTGFADNDSVSVRAKLTGTFSYITRRDELRTIRAFDAGRACARSQIPQAILNDGAPSAPTLAAAAAPSDHSALESLPDHRRVRGIGSGFFVTRDGYLLTNHHVVKDAEKIEVKYNTQVLQAKVIKVDKDNDLALLKVEGANFNALSLSPTDSADLGQPVFTIGFPNIQMQGVAPKFTDGKISSLTGMQDDPADYQISVPVQPGNSGGPLCDLNGQVLGVVVSRLNDLAVLETSGMVPQNVNYAVKARHARRLLQSVKGLQLVSPPPAGAKPDTAVKAVQDAIVMVMIY
ncbi:MAG: serine protease [Verrucomicrobiota bacterium]|jgi:S1-C subfamily serine protease